ncbi:MAG: SPOR domain-containing protein, partial [Candidatus Omnitrophica bacterium]|nr:SPOR domain-containing protein [Candidatus Omnitrophota bacterium]
MNQRFNKESQFELFPSKSADHVTAKKPRLIITDLTLTIDNLIVVFIIFVMALVLCYSFGVERGKGLAERIFLAEKNNSPNSENGVIIAPSSVPEKPPVIRHVIAASKSANEGIKPGTNDAVDQDKRKVLKIPNLEEKINDFVPAQKDLQGNYTVQVASFKQKKDALEEANMIKGKYGH